MDCRRPGGMWQRALYKLQQCPGRAHIWCRACTCTWALAPWIGARQLRSRGGRLSSAAAGVLRAGAGAPAIIAWKSESELTDEGLGMVVAGSWTSGDAVGLRRILIALVPALLTHGTLYTVPARPQLLNRGCGGISAPAADLVQLDDEESQQHRTDHDHESHRLHW